MLITAQTLYLYRNCQGISVRSTSDRSMALHWRRRVELVMRHIEMMTASTLTDQRAKRRHAWCGRWVCGMRRFCCRMRPVNAHGIQTAEPHPYQGFSSRSTCKPSINLLKPLNRSTTAMSSSTASSSKPNFCTAEVCTASQ